MNAGIFVGVDPGPIPGIVALVVWGNGKHEAHAIQCTQAIACTVVRGLVDGAQLPVTLAVEKFVVGRASMRSAQAGEQTRDLVGQLQTLAADEGLTYVARSASQVKPWATDDRLAHARLLEPTKGMRHSRDAARHALFAAVHDGALPDPFSRKARA